MAKTRRAGGIGIGVGIGVGESKLARYGESILEQLASLPAPGLGRGQ